MPEYIILSYLNCTFKCIQSNTSYVDLKKLVDCGIYEKGL